MAIDTVTNNNDSGAGSLRQALIDAAAGDTIAFAPAFFTSATADDIKLSSSLVITKNVNIEGHVGGGSGAANIMIDGKGLVTDLVINAGVAVYIDGLAVEFGKGTGTAGNTAAVGGIFDAGVLTLNNSIVSNNAASGGTGAAGTYSQSRYSWNGTGAQAGGAAAGGIYVASGAVLNLVTTTNAFSANKATGGTGGQGALGYAFRSGGVGGAGGYATSTGASNRAASAGAAGSTGYYGHPGGPGGAAGQPSPPGTQYVRNGQDYQAPSGGGGGGSAFADKGGKGSSQSVAAPCYVRGTLIRTEQGDVAIEDLMIGDRLMTMTGAAMPLLWIGRRAFAGRLAVNAPAIQPICFDVGSLADDVPSRDLRVSPEHAMFIDGALIPAHLLVNGISIRPAAADDVEYFHLELDAHAVIFAEGAPAESFVDDDSRALFHNGHEFRALYPNRPRQADVVFCAPRIEDGFELEAVQRALMKRALRLRAASMPAACVPRADAA